MPFRLNIDRNSMKRQAHTTLEIFPHQVAVAWVMQRIAKSAPV